MATDKTKATHSAAILAALQAGRALNPLDALNEFGCFRLGARIYDLKCAGYLIETKMVRSVDGARFASYSLAS